MKPKFIKVPDQDDYSFRVSTEKVPYFYNPYHYHQAIEITYVLSGKGTRFIGDHFEAFGPRDLVMVGENLAHCWKNNSEYFEEDSQLISQAIVIQFRPEFAKGLFDLVEMKAINSLIREAKKGLKFQEESKPEIYEKMTSLITAQGSRRISGLIELLELMSSQKRISLNPQYQNDQNQARIDRLNDVYEYSIKNQNKKITLEEISKVANLSPNAFCRYFKSHTRKSYTDFLNELRISKVCQMLSESDMNISEIAYTNGFGNLAHFIKTFKKKKGMTPFEYKKNTKYIDI